MYASIVGVEGSGRTVFASLLYAAQIGYSQEKKSGFRFSSNPRTQSLMGEGYNMIRGGMWPESKFSEKVSFLLSYQSMDVGSRMKRMFIKEKEKPKFSIQFNIFDLPDTDLGGSRHQAASGDGLDILYRSDVLIILLDSSRFKDGKDVDSSLGSLVERIKRGKGERLKPVIVFTKWDNVDEKGLKKLKLSTEPPGINDTQGRSRYGRKILAKFYPKLGNIISNLETRYIFIHIEVEKDEWGEKVPKASIDIDNELFYSYDEMRGMLRYLGDIGKLDNKKGR